MRKEKLGKVGLCFLTGCFIKPDKMTINHFFFNRSFCLHDLYFFCKLGRSAVSLFDIRMMQEISKKETGNGK